MTVLMMNPSNQNRLEALKKKHATLKMRIANEQKNPANADFYLKQLKKQKLILKEEIEGIRQTSANGSGA